MKTNYCYSRNSKPYTLIEVHLRLICYGWSQADIKYYQKKILSFKKGLTVSFYETTSRYQTLGTALVMVSLKEISKISSTNGTA